ncbi:type IX secretion system membrane protein PorP/SprF [Marivirga sp. S37H4]|uniref:Type IX secretion system membrane protein PorP/SprF n=1 Tax=Marivirga aurantiaca TaxID=2802615 RepID=A0A934WV25_9BACT|nr:type IX secretion system membrane protein PorP/SprF [Marivirga aurantiaca]MBK6263507.1 type IX secretion system membrane protein PorP/SprF [Marivirga aurantiaca]
MRQILKKKFLIVFKVSVVCFGMLVHTELNAQDPQFSQFYAAPLYLNPAFAGNTQMSRFGINYRNQWPSIDANFTTYSAYFDHFFDRISSGVGMIITRDQEGLVGLRSTSVGLQYAYQLRLTDKLTFRPGTQVAVYNRNLNFDRLTFGDQWDPETQSFQNPTGEGATGESKNFIDLSFGGVLYSSNFWVGYSVFHLNQPNQSILGDESRLPMKHSFHAGYKLPLSTGYGRKGYTKDGDERSITPTAQYKMQGGFDQLDLGVYTTLEPMVVGLWYRGIPFNAPNGFSGSESIVLLVGYAYEKLSVGYSFDYTISDLGIRSGGAHEISISYVLSLTDPRRPPADKLRIPCPKF